MFKEFEAREVSAEWDAFSQWQTTGKWFKYRNHSVFCQIQGEGEPLVLLHGFPTCSWDWHRVWDDLVSRYQLIAIDFLGFGFSDKPAHYAYSLVDQADLISGFLEKMEIASPHFLVHDYGNSVMQELLARHREGKLPFEPGSVCFLNGGLFPEVHQPVFVQKLLSSPVGAMVSRLISEPVFQRNMQHIFSPAQLPDAQLLKEWWRSVEYNNGRAIMHRLIHYIEERRCHRNRWVQALCETAATRRLPMSFVCGTDSPVSGYAMISRYETLIDSPYVVPLRGVGHYPQVEAPERLLEAYGQFRECTGAGQHH